jgi:hypothetical protein
LGFLEVEAARHAAGKFGALPLHLSKKKPEFQKGIGVMGVMARVIEPPKMKAVKSSLDTLRSLRALDNEEKLTPLGAVPVFRQGRQGLCFNRGVLLEFAMLLLLKPGNANAIPCLLGVHLLTCISTYHVVKLKVTT